MAYSTLNRFTYLQYWCGMSERVCRAEVAVETQQAEWERAGRMHQGGTQTYRHKHFLYPSCSQTSNDPNPLPNGSTRQREAASCKCHLEATEKASGLTAGSTIVRRKGAAGRGKVPLQSCLSCGRDPCGAIQTHRRRQDQDRQQRPRLPLVPRKRATAAQFKSRAVSPCVRAVPGLDGVVHGA